MAFLVWTEVYDAANKSALESPLEDSIAGL